MMMTTQTFDPHYFDQKAHQIRAQVSIILTKWGLIPRFKRWRLTQDPSTGMVVLFGVLNNRYLARHTSIAFSDYFDPRVLLDLANELQVQVVSCNSEGLRYAFILDRGQLGKLPTHIDFPFLDGDRLFVGVVYNDQLVPAWVNSQTNPTTSINDQSIDEQTLVDQGVGAFLKVFDDIQLRDEVAEKLAAQGQPDIVVIDEDKFNKRVATYEANQQRIKHIKKLFDKAKG